MVASLPPRGGGPVGASMPHSPSPRRRSSGSGGPGLGGEPFEADGPGGGVPGPVPAAPAVRGRADRAPESPGGLDRDLAGGRGASGVGLAVGLGEVAELLARARAEAARCIDGLNREAEAFDDYARRGEDLAGRLHHEVLASRMRPMSEGVRGFPRMVRDVSRELGKKVRFEVRGENTGVDRDILDKLDAPLNHLIRNALDHAIEPPDERTRAGKDATGLDPPGGPPHAGMLQITVTDDGRGVDPARLRDKVVRRGLATAEMAGQLTEAELLEFLFLPGFSTKDAVTEISGRGVGLDVVQDMVQTVGGVVRVTSKLGRGTRFTLQLPITMSVIRALLVRSPASLTRSRSTGSTGSSGVPRDEVRRLEGRPHFLMDGQLVGLSTRPRCSNSPKPSSAGDPMPVVVVSDRSHRFGVIVDAFLGERDLEVRPLDPRLGKPPDISSASVLDDGWPVLIVDVEDLVRSIDNLLGGKRLKGIASPASVASKARKPAKRILVVDDSITVRELERQLLESRGYAVDVAVDGVDGWNAVRQRRLSSGHQRRRHAADGRDRAGPLDQAGPPAEVDPGRHRVVQGSRGGPDARARRRRRWLSDQEQLPRPDVPRRRGRPDRRGPGMRIGIVNDMLHGPRGAPADRGVAMPGHQVAWLAKDGLEAVEKAAGRPPRPDPDGPDHAGHRRRRGDPADHGRVPLARS